MVKTLFLIPGFRHQATELQYTWIQERAEELGYVVHPITITWEDRVMSQYVEEFMEQFERHATSHNVVFGFSFGAVIAFISAARTKPEQLYLCALTPAFKEDQPIPHPGWAKVVGPERLADLATFEAEVIAPAITAPTTIVCGEAEAEEYPTLLERCRHAALHIPNASLHMAPEAPHILNHPGYKQAILDLLT